jgi:hypothetical protein
MTRSACATSWLHDARYGYGISLAMTGIRNPHQRRSRNSQQIQGSDYPGLARVERYAAVLVNAKQRNLMSNKCAALYVRVSTDAQMAENQTRDILKGPSRSASGLARSSVSQGQKAYLAMLR